MTDDPSRTCLRDLLQAHGVSVCLQPSQCEALLHAAFAEGSHEAALLIMALRAGVPRALLAYRGKLPSGEVERRLVARLVDTLDLNESGARWAVQSWSQALAGLSSAGSSSSLHPDFANGCGMGSRRCWSVFLLVVAALAIVGCGWLAGRWLFPSR